MLRRLQDTTAQIRVRAAFLLLIGFTALAANVGLETILGAFAAGALLSLLDRDETTHPQSYLTDMSQLPEYGKVRAARFTGTPPTVTTVEVSRLFVPGALLEVEVLAIA